MFEFAGAFGDQPVEGIGARLYLLGHAGKGAGEIAEFVGTAPDAGEALRFVARFFEGRRGVGDLDHRGGDLPPDIEPADDEGAENADRVEHEKEGLADVDGAVRGGNRLLGPRLDPPHQVVDIAGEASRRSSAPARSGLPPPAAPR